jgi:hypothetical protein
MNGREVLSSINSCSRRSSIGELLSFLASIRELRMMQTPGQTVCLVKFVKSARVISAKSLAEKPFKRYQKPGWSLLIGQIENNCILI